MKQYWAVRYGGVIRISDKVETAQEACRDTFGVENGSVLPLGPRKTEVRKVLPKLEQMEGWQIIPFKFPNK